jgi:NADPH:quinone reductase-like Zn-dependent oxidoreductase
MKAIQFNRYGGAEVLRQVDIDPPHASPGQIRITVRAAGVNPSDWKRRSGLYRNFESVEFPAGVGVEAAGIVNEIGAGVYGVAIGDPVFGFGINTMAEQALLTHWAHQPGTVSFEVAASLPVVVETAWRCLDEVGVRSGETLLICGAAGGIGSAAIQLARLRGMTVIGTASAAKHDYLRQLGAQATSYGPGLAERVRQLAPAGVDAALDLAGAGIIPDLIDIVGDAGKVLSAADFDAPKYGARFSYGPPRDPQRVLADAARLLASGRLRMHVEQTFPLADTAAAQILSATGRVTGKLVVVMS